jgi:hypothetical protein
MQHLTQSAQSIEVPSDDSGELDLYSIRFVLSAGSKKPQDELARQKMRYHVTHVADQVSPGPPSYDGLEDQVVKDQVSEIDK